MTAATDGEPRTVDAGRIQNMSLSRYDKMLQMEPAMFAQLGMGSSSEVQGPAVKATTTRDSGDETTETSRPGLGPTSSDGSGDLLALIDTPEHATGEKNSGADVPPRRRESILISSSRTLMRQGSMWSQVLALAVRMTFCPVA